MLALLCPCRDELLPAGVDVNPALEVCPDFVRDLPSPVRQPPQTRSTLTSARRAAGAGPLSFSGPPAYAWRKSA
jgi:hypothetical protein